MAQIIPDEFANKSKEELYEDIAMLSRYVTKLRRDIEELQAQMHLKNGEIIKKRTDNFILKSEVGNQNIKIMDLEQQQNNVVDIDFQLPKEEK